MAKGFSPDISSDFDRDNLKNKDPKGRLISWSPWPPANFQKRYPAFPFVLTILIFLVVQSFLTIAK